MERQTDIKKDFLVLFHGNSVPLQGVHHIVRAADLLKGHHNIKFHFVGRIYKDVIKLAEELNINAKFIGRLPPEELAAYIRRADICLSIFGDTPKALRVIPNKLYESIAAGKAVITGDTPAIGELLQDRENILLCRPADPEDLAEKILELKNDPDLRERIARGGYELFKEKLTPKVLVSGLLGELTMPRPEPAEG